MTTATAQRPDIPEQGAEAPHVGLHGMRTAVAFDAQPSRTASAPALTAQASVAAAAQGHNLCHGQAPLRVLGSHHVMVFQ